MYSHTHISFSFSFFFIDVKHWKLWSLALCWGGGVRLVEEHVYVGRGENPGGHPTGN